MLTNMYPIKDKDILSIGFSQNYNILEIEYKNKERYIFKDVDKEIFTKLINSDLKSEFIKRNIYHNYKKMEIII